MMPRETLGQLHAPLMPILRHALALAPLPRAGVALDLACGEGEKTALLIEALGPDVRLIGVDIDPTAFRRPTTDDRTGVQLNAPTTDDRRPTTLTLSSCHPFTGLVADALALPLREGCCDAAFCIAALGLFADQRAALRELRRVLRPGVPALLAVGTQAWAQMIPWSSDLSACLATAYDQALADGAAPIPAALDLGGELAELLADSGFAAPLVRAFWLDHRRPTTDDRRPTSRQALYGGPSVAAIEAELPLLPWPALRALLAGRLPAAELDRCDALAATPEVELCALALVALAHASG